MTGSMERAIGETERRRAKQMAHNKKHGITPQTIRKNIADIMADAGSVPGRAPARRGAEDAAPGYEGQVMDPDEAARENARLEKDRFKDAMGMGFGEAAELRDQ